MKTLLEFLEVLRRNNNREWFADHKAEYRLVQQETEDITARLIDGISSFDGSVSGLSPRDCTYRIYRDTRFSKDKLPYKTHIGIYVCPGGKKSGMSGYYFHIEPPTPAEPEPCNGFSGGSLISVGLYMPEAAVLKSIREEICYNGEEFLRNVSKAEGFSLNRSNALKRIPLGFPSDSPYADYLKLKDIYLEKRMDENILLSGDYISWAVGAFATAYDFNCQLNRAVEYAFENEQGI